MGLAHVEAAFPLMDERTERYIRERYERERGHLLLDRHGQPRADGLCFCTSLFSLTPAVFKMVYAWYAMKGNGI